MVSNTFIAAKAVTAGGLSVFLMNTFNDTEFVVLLLTGLFASLVSFLYDYAHSTNRTPFGLIMVTDIVKYVFYGIPVMVIVYYLLSLNLNAYIEVPITVWGFVSMLCAGSAVTIVEAVAPALLKFGVAILDKVGGVKS